MTWKEKTKKVSGNQIIDSSITFDNLGCTIDEDNMASDSATHVPTQQSVKAYVDANGGGGTSQWTTSGSDIYYNTGFVGIGTTTPSSPLHIHTDDPDFTQEMDSTATANLIEHRFRVDGVTEGSLLYNKADEYFLLSTTKELIFSSANTERMRINSSGNVGIGTTSPAQALHVVGKIRLESNFPTIEFVDTDNNPDFTITGGNGRIGFYDQTNSANRLLVDSSGNVGIGTDSPAYAMDISQTSNASPVGLRIQNSEGSFILRTNGNQTLMDAGTDFIFRNSSETERMRIDSSGRVGIGCTPAETLDVKSGNASTYLRLQTSTDGGVYVGNLSGQMLMLTGTTERMRIDSSGNVGIGTISPSAKLEVSATAPTYTNLGTVLWGGTTNNDNHTGISLSSSGDALGGSVGSNLYYSNSNTATQSNTNRSSGEIKIDNTTSTGTSTIRLGGYAKGTTTFDEHMRIDSSGNVLVGKTADAFNTVGVELLPTGRVYATATSTAPMYSNRKSTDGSIMDFAKDGSTVGSIGTSYQSGARYFHIAHTSTGIGFYSGGIFPCDSSGTFSSGNKDLGSSSVRWQTAYLTQQPNVSSDQRLKQNIEDADDAGSTIDAIQVRKFDWIEDGRHQKYGMIAQELAEVYPEAVNVPENEEDTLGIATGDLIPMLIKEVQSLRSRVAELENV